MPGGVGGAAPCGLSAQLVDEILCRVAQQPWKSSQNEGQLTTGTNIQPIKLEDDVWPFEGCMCTRVYGYV